MLWMISIGVSQKVFKYFCNVSQLKQSYKYQIMKNHDYFLILINSAIPSEQYVKKISDLAKSMRPFKIIFLVNYTSAIDNLTNYKKLTQQKVTKKMNRLIAKYFDNISHFDIEFTYLQELNIQKYLKILFNEPTLILYDEYTTEESELEKINRQVEKYPNFFVSNISNKIKPKTP